MTGEVLPEQDIGRAILVDRSRAAHRYAALQDSDVERIACTERNIVAGADVAGRDRATRIHRHVDRTCGTVDRDVPTREEIQVLPAGRHGLAKTNVGSRAKRVDDIDGNGRSVHIDVVTAKVNSGQKVVRRAGCVDGALAVDGRAADETCRGHRSTIGTDRNIVSSGH